MRHAMGRAAYLRCRRGVLAFWLALGLLGCGRTESDRDSPSGANPSVTAPQLDATTSKPTGELKSLRISGMEFRVPAEWIEEEPASAMRLAQYRLPGPAGDAELTVTVAGGTVEANLERWYSQFGLERGRTSPHDAREQTLEVAGYKAVLVELRGTYAPGPVFLRPGQPAEQKGFGLLGAIIETPGQSTFFKAVGPDETLNRHRDAFVEFVRSGRRTD